MRAGSQEYDLRLQRFKVTYLFCKVYAEYDLRLHRLTLTYLYSCEGWFTRIRPAIAEVYFNLPILVRAGLPEYDLVLPGSL